MTFTRTNNKLAPHHNRLVQANTLCLSGSTRKRKATPTTTGFAGKRGCSDGASWEAHPADTASCSFNTDGPAEHLGARLGASPGVRHSARASGTKPQSSEHTNHSHKNPHVSSQFLKLDGNFPHEWDHELYKD